MKQNKEKDPMQENTKDDSSDVKRVKQNQPENRATNQANPKEGGKESEEAQKGHS